MKHAGLVHIMTCIFTTLVCTTMATNIISGHHMSVLNHNDVDLNDHQDRKY